MINYWWVSRPKRKLNSVPEVLGTFAELSLNQQWEGERQTHLVFEDALEKAGLKRVGERRDQGGGGARTYKAWLVSLGLIFIQESTKQIKLTLAGEAILNGEPPVDILKNQVIKYQFPSAFSVGKNVEVSPRFKVHPFVFLLKLLSDDRINYLDIDEIANIIIVEADNDSEKCYERIVQRLLDYREFGGEVLPNDFLQRYGLKHGSSNLLDVANTMMNWLAYTQLAFHENKKLFPVEEKMSEIKEIASKVHPFIDRPESHEYYQRKYGIDPKHDKDLRNLTNSKTVTDQMLEEQKVVNAYMSLSLDSPITCINNEIVNTIVTSTGVNETVVISTLRKRFPKGSIGPFMTNYYEMAFKGTKEATKFERATLQIFKDIFGFKAKHVGPIGLTPDVLIESEDGSFVGIIDTKAYSKYSISNDHHNRMVHNYIPNISHYYDGGAPLAFFMYIAGGFGNNIDSQIKAISDATGVHGSCINVHNLIELVKRVEDHSITQEELRKLFSVDKQINSKDFENI